MATRNIVPRADEEGNLGTSLKKWLKGWFKNLFVSNEITDGTNSVTISDVKDAVDKKHLSTKLGSKHIDESNIGDLKIIQYELSGDKLKYISLPGGGDMLKSIYDTDDDGIVDQSESLNDGSSGGGNNITAKEARDHIDDVANPHSITKSQVGLGNVTNDSQLKREAGDIDSFSEKTSIHDNDLILIEDSEDSNNKKKVKRGNLVANIVTKEVFFQADYSSNEGNFRTKVVGGGGSFNFNFVVPHDFSSIDNLVIVGIIQSGAIGTNRDIDLFSNYGTIGEVFNNHLESDTTTTYDFSTYSAGEIIEIDISGVFTNLSAGDYCGINIDHNGIGGQIEYLGIRLKYT